MPKDNKPPARTPRRAASKEALKQMHLLLGDENRYEISSDEDDDVIEVAVEPPKKKYKLSHRKSADGNDRDVIVLKTVPNAASDGTIFDLDVEIEELSAAQKSRRELYVKENKEMESKIEQLLAAPNTEVIYKGVLTTAVEATEQLQSIIAGASAQGQFTIPNQSTVQQVQQTVPGQSIVLQQQPSSGNNAMQQSYKLVMDHRLGVIVGTMATQGGNPAASSLLYQPAVAIPSTPTNTPEQPMKTRRGTILRQVTPSAMPMHKAALVQQKQTPKPQQMAKPLQVKSLVGKAATPKAAAGPKAIAAVGPKTIAAVGPKTIATVGPKTIATVGPKTIATVGPKAITAAQKPVVAVKARPAAGIPPGQSFRPTESSVEGGLNMGTKPAKSIDLTGEDGRALPDSREVSFNKLQGRTYPSLVVVARPHLRVKDLASDRGKLDVKVKSVLMYPPTKFTEWLIQQGLVRSDQKCTVHPGNALKLGMYSDASKFPYSGGYVWISECCPQRFVSVFSGSLFEGSQHPPMAILKLLYHWCCQTIVQNVTQWVKVDNLYVKGMYTWLRSVCTVALHTHIKQLGGPGVKVQVGVISLGTTSQDGNKREVKVEVLGILETTTRHIRLRAVEPLADGERNYKKRFTKILEPVFNWVHPASVIVTDLTVDKATLHQMGFLHVAQGTSTDYSQSNRTIMEYLRRIVPRMFQNTLSLLSRQIIQQFLDELVWREWYGTTVLQCFDNMIQHMSEETRCDGGLSLITRLNKVSSNPFKNWSIPSTPAVVATPQKSAEPTTLPKRYSRQRKTATPQPPVTLTQEVPRPAKSTSPDVPEQMVPLENYYYGTITPIQTAKTRITINIKCPFCKLTFNTNIALMNHLFKHAHNVSNEVQLCRYCLTIVPTGNDLLKHIGTSHPDETKFDNGFVCLICEAHFRNPFILGKHMSKEHCPSELPYLCGTCHFRCSSHKQAVDHFYQQHDHGTTIQCPFCLKSTTIFSGGRNITQNMNYFIQHLQKHQKKQLAKRCGRCTLWFIQKEFLKDHQTKMHISQRGKSGLVPCFAPRNGVMVPKSRMDKCPDDAKLINFSALFFNVGKNLNCKECNKPLNTPKHFASFEGCQNPNCQFATCCSNSMLEHVSKCKFLNTKLPEEKLPHEMFCICGYKDIYGNLMAKHLAICERKTAYPSKKEAKEATVTHSMLDVLGLVRKPDEASSSKAPPKEQPHTPIILKPRGRPRKNANVEKVDSPVVAKEVIELNDDDGEVKLSISDVRGGVECDDVKRDAEEVRKPQESVDLTENDSSPEPVADERTKSEKEPESDVDAKREGSETVDLEKREENEGENEEGEKEKSETAKEKEGEKKESETAKQEEGEKKKSETAKREEGETEKQDVGEKEESEAAKLEEGEKEESETAKLEEGEKEESETAKLEDGEKEESETAKREEGEKEKSDVQQDENAEKEDGDEKHQDTEREAVDTKQDEAETADESEAVVASGAVDVQLEKNDTLDVQQHKQQSADEGEEQQESETVDAHQREESETMDVQQQQENEGPKENETIGEREVVDLHPHEESETMDVEQCEQQQEHEGPKETSETIGETEVVAVQEERGNETIGETEVVASQEERANETIGKSEAVVQEEGGEETKEGEREVGVQRQNKDELEESEDKKELEESERQGESKAVETEQEDSGVADETADSDRQDAVVFEEQQQIGNETVEEAVERMEVDKVDGGEIAIENSAEKDTNKDSCPMDTD